MYLISIYFDEKTNNRMQSYIKQVAKRSGNTFMTEKNVPPHLTISAFETRNENTVCSLLEEKKEIFQKGELTWCSVGTFFPHVIYLAPVLNLYLQELSEKVYEMLRETDGIKIHGCYRPMQWFPHKQLGRNCLKKRCLLHSELCRSSSECSVDRQCGLVWQERIHMKSCGNLRCKVFQVTRLV